jgi:taurine dioxygenase
LAPFGVQVDLDLSQDVSADVIDVLVKMYSHHHLILFRSQSLSMESQARVTGWFGPLLPGKTGMYISTDPDVGGLGSGRLAFHSDLSCTPHPLLGLSLHAVTVEDGATSTIFVDAVGAAASLPETLRRRIEGLHTRNLWPTRLSERQRITTVPAGWPGADHPVVMMTDHGHMALYVNENHTDGIVELEPRESEELVQALFAHLYAPKLSYEHRWYQGDFIVWNNLALQHGREALPPGTLRTLQKIELGTHGYAELMPPQLLEMYASQ